MTPYQAFDVNNRCIHYATNRTIVSKSKENTFNIKNKSVKPASDPMNLLIEISKMCFHPLDFSSVVPYFELILFPL